MATDAAMRPLTHTVTNTCTVWAHTPTHAGDTQDVWSPKRSSQGPSLKAVAVATDRHTQHSSTPPRGRSSQRRPGCTLLYTHTHTHILKTQCTTHQGLMKQEGTLTDTSVCASPCFRITGVFLAAHLKVKAGVIFLIVNKTHEKGVIKVKRSD